MNEFSLVEYELESTDLNRLDVSGSPYVAMSYSWGDPVLDSPLIVIHQGQRTVLPVTASAWEAVQRTLPAIGMYGKLMWIDQICINQNEKPEKEKQVMLMGDIYRRCWHCMIWLGPATADTRVAYSLFDRIQKTFDFKKPIPINHIEIAGMSHARVRAKLVSKLGRDVIPPETDPGWAELAKLLQRSWFTRLWTFQEAVLCYKGDASVCCGQFHIPVITFMRASMFLGHEHVFAGIDFTSGRAALAQISNFRWHVEHGQVTPLIWLLQNNNLRDCFNPRDRIYALLGVRKEDGPQWDIEVSYKKPSESLFIDVTRKIIQSQASLRVCADAPERVQNNGLSDLPSWVPNWTRKPLTSTFELLNPSKAYFRSSIQRIHADIVQDPKILTVKGKKVDTLVNIIETEVPDSFNEMSRRRTLVSEVLPHLQATLQSIVPRVADVDIAHLIVNTITVGGYTRASYLGESGVPSEAWSKVTCQKMLSYIFTGGQNSTLLPPHVDPEQWLDALARQAIQCANRRFAVLKDNQLALVPKTSRIDDSVVILHGSSLPLILRPADDNDCFKLIGPCYVDQIMYGDRVDWVQGDEFRIS
ncbi:MAG: hypothetical protein Q9227_002035 [Pyrenula ochraceoflavens]